MTIFRRQEVDQLQKWNKEIDDEGLNVAKLITKEVISIETGLRLSNADFDSYDLAAVNRNKEGCIHVSQNSANSNNLKVDILLPNRLKTIHALLEERMRFGIALTKNCLLKGTSKIWYKDEAYVVPAMCLEYAARALKEWKKIENISCIVTLEQKNVY